MRLQGSSYGGAVRGTERGSRNEKVVSSADTSSVTISILHQSPFRFTAAAASYVVTVETASYHEERLYETPNLLSLVIGDRFSTRSYPRIYDFPHPVSTHEWRQANLSRRLRLAARPHDDRSIRLVLNMYIRLVPRRVNCRALFALSLRTFSPTGKIFIERPLSQSSSRDLHPFSTIAFVDLLIGRREVWYIQQ